MINPFSKYLLVRIIDPPKKHSLIMVSEEEDPIVKCELIRGAGDTWFALSEDVKYVLYIRRYELRDCVDKEQKIYLVKEECVLGYEEGA